MPVDGFSTYISYGKSSGGMLSRSALKNVGRCNEERMLMAP